MLKKVLKGITQYNDCWFRNTYNQQKIAAYSFFGCDPDILVCNYIIEVGNEDGQIIFAEKQILTPEELEAATDVSVRYTEPADIIERVHLCMRRERPMIVALDSYCLPFRKENFGVSHAPHYVLIHGIDLNKKILTIGANTGVRIFDFKTMEVPFDVVRSAYESFKVCLKQPDSVVVAEFTEAESIPVYKKSEALNKLKKAFFERNYVQHAALYRTLLTKTWTQEELLNWKKPIVKYTDFFRILMVQCHYMYGDYPHSMDLLYEIWDRALRIMEIIKNAADSQRPELITDGGAQKLALEMEERLLILNRLRALENSRSN